MNNEPYLDSVSARIAASIIKFARKRVGGTFHADELRGFVLANVGTCAPGSADRILRNLRQKGALDYVVIDRTKSLYLLRSVSPAYDLIWIGVCEMSHQPPKKTPEPPYRCGFCGMPSWVDPSDQSPPPDYCHESDHGEYDVEYHGEYDDN